jgi:hypothetical protein
METQTTALKPRWTASRLFWISSAGFILSLVVVGIAGLLWWPLAFDWDSDKLPIPAYIDVGVGIVGAVTGVLSIIVMIISGTKALLSHERPAV